MKDTNQPNPTSNGDISDAEWENRRLCPDGNCIGVIGPDGRCKECGLSAGEDLPSAEDMISDAPTDEGDTAEAAPAPATPSDQTPADDNDHWANRRLCPDGNCIGVIGPDGRCKECGRPDKKS